MEETLTRLADSVDQVQRKFYGVTVGRVINPLDPLTLGRVQVQLPMIDDVELSPWGHHLLVWSPSPALDPLTP